MSAIPECTRDNLEVRGRDVAALSSAPRRCTESRRPASWLAAPSATPLPVAMRTAMRTSPHRRAPSPAAY
jgi:hypothetical protein